jgi:site-specific DNA-methyltransferase (adenine-specific)
MLPLNQIYCGDCVTVMQSIDDNYIDLTVTSPPYDNLRTYKGYNFNFESIAQQLYRVTKDGGVVVWVVGDATIKGSETGTSFKQALYFKEIGFNLHDTMLFVKNNPLPTDSRYRYQQKFEYIFVLSKGNPKTFNPIMVKTNSKRQYRSSWGRKDDYMIGNTGKEKITKDDKISDNIFYYSISKGGSTKDKFAFKHPAIFPEQLTYDQIMSWSNPGDIVLDPMCGSGTTCKMAKLNNRNFIGIDCSEEYCEIAKQRIA